MSCPSFEQLVEGAGTEGVARHAEGCPACAAELAALARRRAAMKSLPPPPPPVAGWPNLQSAWSRARRRRAAVRSSLALAAAAALVLLLWPAVSPPPAPVAGPVTPELVRASQRLEAELAALSEPSVVDVQEADARAELEDEIAWIDQCLAELDPGASDRERAALWKTRIDLLESLLRARRPPAVLVSL